MVEVAVERAKEEIKITSHLMRQLKAFGIPATNLVEMPLDFIEELQKGFDLEIEFANEED